MLALVIALLLLRTAVSVVKIARRATDAFAVVLDAGSSGTRVQVVRLSRDGDTLRSVKFHQVPTSLTVTASSSSSSSSTTTTTREHVARVLQPLLRFARRNVPFAHVRRKAPIMLYATAGLRQLADASRREAILDACRAELARSGFDYRPERVRIMDGGTEALYSWTTVNYLLRRRRRRRRISLGGAARVHVRDGDVADAVADEAGWPAERGRRRPPPSTPQTVGILELGGGSVQIAFEPPPDVLPELDSLLEGERAFFSSVRLPGDRGDSAAGHAVYAHSHSGFGLYDFQRRAYDRLRNEGRLQRNPCALRMHNRAHTVRVGVDRRRVNTTGTGDFDACMRVILAEFEARYTDPSEAESESEDEGEGEGDAADEQRRAAHPHGQQQQQRRHASTRCTMEDASHLIHHDYQCVLQGTYQPHPRGIPFIAFAFFHERTVGVGVLPEVAQLSDVYRAGVRVCAEHRAREASDEPDATDARGVERGSAQAAASRRVGGAHADEELCFDLAYVYALMVHGLGFGDDRLADEAEAELVGASEMHFACAIDGVVLGWALGAALVALEQPNATPVAPAAIRALRE